MGAKPRIRAVAIAAILATTGLVQVAPTSHAKKPKGPKTFVAEGNFYGTGLITHYDFLLNCPGPPATQGVDAFVVAIPGGFGGTRSSTATIDYSATVTAGNPVVSFYDYGCTQGELYLSLPTEVPAGTGFLVVQDLQGANAAFELTLTQN